MPSQSISEDYAAGPASVASGSLFPSLTPSGSGYVNGAVSQPELALKTGLRFNVRAYGAVGDGVTDDRAAIQAVISAAPAGSAIFFPAGTYKLTAPLVDAGSGHDRITLLGTGQGSKLVVATVPKSAIAVGARDGWVIQGLWIYGSGYDGDLTTSPPEGCGVVFSGATNCAVSDCRIEHLRKCVYLQGACHYCLVTRNFFIDANNAVNEDCFGAATNAAVTGNVATHNVSVSCRAHYITDNRNPAGNVLGVGMLIANNVIDGHNVATSERYGVRIYDANGSVVSGNIFSNVEVGVELMRGAKGCSVIGNTMHSFSAGTYGGHGVWVHEEPAAPTDIPLDNVISGNVIRGAAAHGVFLAEGRHTVVVGNVISAPVGEGVRAEHAYVSVSNNRIVEPTSHGVYITEGGGSSIIQGNYIQGKSTDTGFTADAIRIDGASGGPVSVVGNMLWNDQTTAGFNFGVNRPSGALTVELDSNKFFRLVQPVSPTSLLALKSYSDEVLASSNEGQWIRGKLSEVITLSTGGTVTDSTANLLLGNGIIEAVVARVVTTIVTATDWRLGDAGTAGRFSAASTGLTAGSLVVGTIHADQTGAAGPRQTVSAKLRITTTGTPSAGAIRVTVFYRQFSPPTS